MYIPDQIKCIKFPCLDVHHAGYLIPDCSVDPQQVSMLMISESAPQDSRDYYYAGGEAAYENTTLQAFKDAGIDLDAFDQLADMDIYLTSAVKCSKTGYGIRAGTIQECSLILEKEIGLFPNIKVIMLMGDVAINAINFIARRAGLGRVIPADATYKIRSGEYYFRDIRLFPSYMQVGPSFGIEKSKRKMIAEDIQNALEYRGYLSQQE
jgi:uracil-DNA glycosylase